MNKESYLHKYAKIVLKSWLLKKPSLIGVDEIFRIDIEKQFCSKGFILFIPDLAIYTINGVNIFVEIYHKNKVSFEKLHNIRNYLILYQYDVRCYEISAYWIMSQIKIPKDLNINKIL